MSISTSRRTMGQIDRALLIALDLPGPI